MSTGTTTLQNSTSSLKLLIVKVLTPTLDQIEWYFNLKGSVIDGTFVPIGEHTPTYKSKALIILIPVADAPKAGSCPSRYPPESGRPIA